MHIDEFYKRPENQAKPRIQSIERAMIILDCIAKHNYQLGLTELARITNLNKATAYGIVSTLESANLVILTSERKYALGFKLLELGSLVEGQLDFRKEIKPYMDRLATKYNANVHLGVKADTYVLYIDLSLSAHALPIPCSIGEKLPCYASGAGKAILSFLPQNEINDYIQQLTEYDSFNIFPYTAEKIIEELRITKERGYAIDDEEHQPGVYSMAVPIFRYDGFPIAAISLAMVKTRYTEELQTTILEDLKKCSNILFQPPSYSF